MERSAQPSWSALASEGLGDAGYRSGGARSAVVELLAEGHCCLTAQEIADRLRSQGEGIGIASVYRALDLLHGIGLVARIEVGDGGTRYEAVVPGGEHHHHVVCDSCGRISSFQDDALERAIDELATRLDYRVSGHDVLIRGHCAACDQAAR